MPRLGNGPQLESDQVASWVPGLLLHLPPLPALDLLFVCAAVSIAPLGAAPAFLPMSSARLKNPLSSVLLFSEFLRCYSPVFPRQKLPLALAGHLLLPLHFAHHSYTAYVQGALLPPVANKIRAIALILLATVQDEHSPGAHIIARARDSGGGAPPATAEVAALASAPMLR